MEGSSDLEIELKLSGAQDALARAWADTPDGTGEEVTKQLTSTYFDTADFRLRRRGFNLRVRSDGARRVQTIKADGAAGVLLRRGEWSQPVSTDFPDLGALPDQGVREAIGLVLPAELKPIFRTDVRRRVKTVRVPCDGTAGTLIELAYDEGEIRANGTREPIGEIELELVEGTPEALYDCAASLQAQTPLQIQPVSKSRRGYALATGARYDAVRAPAVALVPDVTLDTALGLIFQACLQHWLANHAAVLDGRDPEGVHQMRVALRRMRSAFSVFRRALPPEATGLQAEAKRLLKALGPARDGDVFIDEILAPVRAARPADADLQALHEAAERARRKAYVAARAALHDPRYTAFALELGAWCEGRGWRHAAAVDALDRPLIALADRLLEKRHRRVLKLGRRFETLSDASLHEVRIALKKLRYTAEFFASLYPRKRTKPYVKALRRLQDDLGHLNDVAVAEARLRDLLGAGGSNETGALATGAGTVLGWYAHALTAIRPRIGGDWHAFVETRPFWRDGKGKRKR